MAKCYSINGKVKIVPDEKLIFRMAVYGLILKDDEILVMNIKGVDSYFFPGGGVEQGEILEEALRREVKEETGFNVNVKKFLDFKESFYYSPLKKAYHEFMFFYLCEIRSGRLTEDEKNVEYSEHPHWEKIKYLKIKNFQYECGKIFEAHLKLSQKYD